MGTTRRPRHDPATTKTQILDTVERLMLEEGYAAVTTRRVAREAAMTAAAVHYHYPTTDDLLVAAYRRTTEVNLQNLVRALTSDDPLGRLWSLQSDATHTALAMEFMALANHRKVISQEITRYAELTRRLKADALSRLVDSSAVDPELCPPMCMATLMVSIARTLITEQAVGISLGHADTRRFVQLMLERLRPASRKGQPAG